jgi:hypothetical protein
LNQIYSYHKSKFNSKENCFNFSIIFRVEFFFSIPKYGIRIQDTRACRGATCGSDHHLVKAKILFPSRNVKTENIDSKDEIDTKPKGYNLDSLQHESTRILYQNKLNEKLKRNSFFGNTDELYNHIKESIQEAPLEALGHNDINRRAKPYWWDPDIEKDIEDKRQKYIQQILENT